MKDLFTVMIFTMKDMISRKSFIISTLIILALIVIGCNVPKVLNKTLGEDAFSNSKLLIVDSKDIYKGSLESLKEQELGYEIQVSNENLSFENVKEKINNGDVDEAIILSQENYTINMEYIVENTSYITEVPSQIVNAMSQLYTNLKIAELNLTETQIETINPIFNFEMKQTAEKEANGNVFVMMMLSLVLFYAIYFCAYQVSTSITIEKTSKIIETLVTSTTPKIIVLGKTFGIGLVGLLQLAVFVITAIVSVNVFVDSKMLEGLIDLSTFTPTLAIISIVYFIFGYALYALMYALTGSTVSKPEEIQSANTPVALVAVIGFYLAYFTMMNPTSQLNQFAALLPISSPFCMPLRIMMGVATVKEVVCSLGLLLILIVIIAQISIKIYSQAILNYGTKITLKDMFKMYKNKNI